MVKEKLIVSACFLNDGYKYDGTNNKNEKIIALGEKYDFIPVCPEVFGGLKTPRIPSEQLGDKVMMIDGTDVTEAFYNGALKSLMLAKQNGVTKAILKARSPSCGKGYIYDGTFSHTLINGNGVFAQMALDAGIKIYTEDEIEEL